MKTIYLQSRAVVRFLLFVLFVLAYFLFTIVGSLTTMNSIERRRRRALVCSKTCQLVMWAFNIRLTVKNEITSQEQSLLVGNHIGFIDIICLQSIQPSIFITSLEMKKTPVLGQICDLAGCAYVDRKSRMKIQDELKDIIQVLKDGFRVVLYAESVASNGEQVLPFKKTLMMSAALASRPIRPFVFNFKSINDEPVQFKYRDSVCWYGDQTFFPAIWRSLQLDSVSCEIEFLSPVFPTVDEDRTALSQKIHKMVSEKYIPFVAPTMSTIESTKATGLIQQPGLH